MWICVRGEGNLAAASVISSWVWGLALKPLKVKDLWPSVGQTSSWMKREKLMWLKNCLHSFHRELLQESGRNKMMKQDEKCNSVCPGSACDLYSAGSWDGDRCLDLTSHCVTGVDKLSNIAKIWSRRQTNLSRRQYSGTENREVLTLWQ